MIQAFQGLMARQQDLDRIELETPPDQRKRIERWNETNLEALDSLQRAMAAVPAEDQQGAVVQVLVALDRLTALRDQTDRRDLDEELEVLQRLLRSALPVLAEGAGLDLRPYAGERYVPTSAEWPFFMPRPTGA